MAENPKKAKIFGRCPGSFIMAEERVRTSKIFGPRRDWGRRENKAIVRYRVFNSAEYRIYINTSAPPQPGDTPTLTTASLPYEDPGTTFVAPNKYYISMSYFNGVYDSGFYPIGPAGESYLILDLSVTPVVTTSRPLNPQYATAFIRYDVYGTFIATLQATYFEEGDNRATEFAAWYSYSGYPSDGESSPDYTATIDDNGIAVMEWSGVTGSVYPATAYFRVKTRRLIAEDTYVYSKTGVLASCTADASAVTGNVIQAWPRPVGEAW